MVPVDCGPGVHMCNVVRAGQPSLTRSVWCLVCSSCVPGMSRPLGWAGQAGLAMNQCRRVVQRVNILLHCLWLVWQEACWKDRQLLWGV
jgi:hypothetical protein